VIPACPIDPIDDRVAVVVDAAERTTAGGIVVPTTAAEAPRRGTVVAVGPGHVTADGTRVPMTLRVGDRVVYGRYAGTEVEIDRDTKITIMREDEVLGRLHG
jgi:chaperonin GroES